MKLIDRIVVVGILAAFLYAAAAIRNSGIGGNISSSTAGIDKRVIRNNINGSAFSDIIRTQERPSSRHLLGRNTECVLYLKDIQYVDGHGEDLWSCELPLDVSRRFGGVTMMEIKGVSKEELDAQGAVSGESIVRVDASAYVERSFLGSRESVVLQIPQASNYDIEMMDSKTDTRHARNRRDRIRRRRRLDSELSGSLDTLKVLVVRVIDGTGKGPNANAETLQGDIFTGNICLKSQYEACSHDQVLIVQATEFSSVLENNVEVPGIVDLRVDALAEEGNHRMLEFEAVTAANKTFGAEYSLPETFDLVMFCQPGGTGDWLAYAYVNDWRSFYNNEWCQRVSAQMHEVGHNLNLAHSGLPNDSVYADKSGMMGFSYNSEDGPIQCFNAAKSYQLGWYKEQTLSINPLDYIGDPQTFTLNGIADYRKNGVNGDALVSLRLEHKGSQGGIDYYIGYNRKKGCNIGTAQVPNRVTLIEKENPYAISKDTVVGPDGYGLSRRLAALRAGESMTLKNYAGTSSHVTLTVNSVKGKKASITISISAPKPTHAPTICTGNNLKIKLGTDAFGAETRWSIKDKDTREVITHSTEGYFSNTEYELPGPDSSYCVTPEKCYIFTITDRAGDGMCCSYGLGFYQAYLEEKLIFKGGTFGYEDSIEFCIPSGDDDEFIVHTTRPSASSTEAPIPTERLTGRPTDTVTSEPSAVPTEDPVDLSPSPSLSPSESLQIEIDDSTIQCSDSQVFRHKGKEKWDCEWLSTKGRGRKRKICNKNFLTGKVFDQCQKVCGKAGLGPCTKKKIRSRKHRIGSIENAEQ